MKTITILLALFISLNLKDSKNLTIYEMEKNRIENSIVKINGRGSGSLITINNYNYVLTNAHVCLAPRLDEVLNKGVSDISFSYEIQSKHEQMFVSAEQYDLEYNLKEDWCVIPLEHTIRYPIISQKMVSKIMPRKAVTLTYNHQENTKKLDRFIGCVTDSDVKTNEKVDPTFCQFSPKIQDPSYLTFTNSAKQSKAFYLDEHYVYQFPTIAGDSGSPVFNEKHQLVGLVTGRRWDDNDTSITLWAHVTPMVSFKSYLKIK